MTLTPQDDWLELPVAADAGELCAWHLWELGAVAVLERPHPDGVLLVAGFVDPDSLATAHAMFPSSVIATSQQRWGDSWKRYAHAYSVGERVTIVPAWIETPHDACDAVVVIDPRDSFGLMHVTTAMCIDSLCRFVDLGAVVLDVGCGSGVLSVVAAMLGAREVHSLDTSADAVECARWNVERNHVSDRVVVHLGGPDSVRTQFDVVVANIGGANALIEMAGELRRATKVGGILVLCGLLDVNLGPCTQAFAKWESVSAAQSDGWNCLMFRR